MKEIEILGANRFEAFTKTRAGSRAVIVRDGRMLLTHETVSGWWLVPGGGLEEGETPEECCVREVEEETGIIGLTPDLSPKDEGGRYLSKSLPSPNGEGLGVRMFKTYHIFNLYGGWHLKQTSWFDAHVAGRKPGGKPQDEEGITEVVWVTPDEWYRRLQGSYGTLKTLSTKWMQSAK